MANLMEVFKGGNTDIDSINFVNEQVAEFIKDKNLVSVNVVNCHMYLYIYVFYFFKEPVKEVERKIMGFCKC
jgi:hypothetical protein